MKKSLFYSTILLLCGSVLADAGIERLKPYTVDRISIADVATENQRVLNPVKSSVAKGFRGVLARSAAPGGGFSYEMSVDGPDVAQLLMVRYSGDERPLNRNRLLFKIVVDGREIATQGLQRNLANSFVDEFYPLPKSVSANAKNGKVTVAFVPYDKNCAVGGVYEIATVRAKTRFGLFSEWGKANPEISIPGSIVYTEPDGPQGWRIWGWESCSDGVFSMHNQEGLELDVELVGTREVELEFIATMQRTPRKGFSMPELERRVKLGLDAPGRQKIFLKFKDFANPGSHISGIMFDLKSLEMKTSGKSGKLKIHDIRLLEGYKFAVKPSVSSQPAAAGESVDYTLNITNTELHKTVIRANQVLNGYEGMTTRITPEKLELEPNQTGKIIVSVNVPKRIPKGGREVQKIRLTPGGDSNAAKIVELITFAKFPHPFILHDADGWREVREKTEKYEWAKIALKDLLARADKWNVPAVAVFSLSNDTRRPNLVDARQEGPLMDNAFAYAITRDPKYAEKVALFLRRVCDPVNGFARTHIVGHQAAVQEGHVFQHLAQAYDLIADAGVLSETDVKNIKDAFRLYCEIVIRTYSNPSGANWAVSVQMGALFCAMAIEDLSLAEYFTFGPGMLVENISGYTMSDGWWYECTISYNLWCAEEFVQMSLAMERFGYSLLHRQYPVFFGYTPDFQLDDETELNIRRNIHYGHSFRKFGNISSRTVTIKKMFDALVPYLDYRGWIFGINDSTEADIGGNRFEMAYYAFRDPRYAAFIKKSKVRKNLIYGVGEIPDVPVELGTGSACSDNVGVMMLRSRQQEPRERIQAVLKYGTHGGYHGHYDCTGLLSMMRYGRSFFNPVMVWYSYQPFMYNFYVQSSIAKNMVTVDLKQQEVGDSARLLFSDGDFMQAGAVETTARWSNPPYGGLRWGDIGFPTFSSKTQAEGRSVPIARPEPAYGAMSDFTEPVLQRRLMAVAEDYIVIADYVKGEKPHNFDKLFQIKGLKNISAPRKEWVKHTAQLDPDRLKSAQLITDVNWYEVTGTAKLEFLTRFGGDADNRGTRIHGEDGNLFINLYYAWPNAKRTLFTGRVPENHSVARKLAWSAKGDGKVLASGEFGAWILGSDNVDIDITNLKNLELSTAIESRNKVNTLFWANAVIETEDGKTIPLSSLKTSKTNIMENKYGVHQDFGGGRININGIDRQTGLSAEPVKTGLGNPGVIRIDLSSLKARRFKAVIGGDYPVGPEAERRMTAGLRIRHDAATFLTVMEPFEKQGVIAEVNAPSGRSLEVKLKDGRIHRWEIQGLDGDGKNLELKLSESMNGRTLRHAVAK